MRIRTIKPEFFTHEALFEAESETGLPLRLAFIGLWCAADREGRFKWHPRRLGVQILPYDGTDFSRVLDALVTRGFLVKYRVGDECFGVIPSFTRHQVINNREAESVFPGPDAENAEILSNSDESDASGTREARVTHASKGEGKGREGKGREYGKEGNTAAPTPPADAAGEQKPKARFAPPTRAELDLEAAKLALPDTQVTLFVSYYASNGWKVGRNPMRSWQHALAGWAARWREKEGQLAIGAHHAHHAPRNPLDTSSDPNATF